MYNGGSFIGKRRNSKKTKRSRNVLLAFGKRCYRNIDAVEVIYLFRNSNLRNNVLSMLA